jgi:hypothetical protein
MFFTGREEPTFFAPIHSNKIFEAPETSGFAVMDSLHEEQQVGAAAGVSLANQKQAPRVTVKRC